MKRPLVLVCPLLLLASAGHGATCGTASLETYIGSPGCTIGDLLFSGFNYTPPSPLVVDDSEINVSPIEGGFQFSGPWGVFGSQNMDFLLGFTVTAQTGTITGSRLEIGDPSGTAANGAIYITETQCLNGTFDPNMACGGEQVGLSAWVTPAGVKAVDEITYTTADVTSVAVIKDVMLRGNGEGGVAAFSLLYNTFSGEEGGGGGPGTIPEPGSLFLMGSGLLATAVYLRRRQRI